MGSWVRVVAAVAAFVVVGALTLLLLLSLAPDQATFGWALATLLAAGAGIVAYAAVEYAETGGVASISSQLPPRIILLMPLAIALDIVLGQAVTTGLRVPFHLDSVGVVLVGALGGPVAGAITGLLGSVLWATVVPPPFQGPSAAAFALTAAVVGLLAGSFTSLGFLRPRPGGRGRELLVAAVVAVGIVVALGLPAVAGSPKVAGGPTLLPVAEDSFWQALGWIAIATIVGTGLGLLYLLAGRRDTTAAFVVVAGGITGLVAACIRAPIAAGLAGESTGSGVDLLVDALRQGVGDLGAGLLGQAPFADPIDKVVTFLAAYLILTALSVRTRARYPQGDLLIADGDLLDPAGLALRATRW